MSEQIGKQAEEGPVPPVEQQAAAAVDDSLTAKRHEVEQMRASNAAGVQSLAARGVGVTEASLVGVRLEVLVTLLYGDMDAAPRLAYELAVEQKFGELIAGAGKQAAAQVARAQLLQGVRLDPPPDGGQGPRLPHRRRP